MQTMRSGTSVAMGAKDTGDRGERLAAAYLEARGYRVLERNYRFASAEVDLVCFQPAEAYEAGGELVFVEVKTRTGLRYGRPEEAVSPEKQRHIVRAAEAYLHERRLEGSPCRFDVVSVLLTAGEPQIEHFKDAFWIF
jgi:putative endonuclease